MDLIKSMQVFAEVAKQQGFAPAARALEISTSSVSRHVIDLESWFGVTLFQRTTRHLAITEDGSRYLTECQKVLGDIERIRHLAYTELQQPTGTLRITAPVFLAKACISRALPDFLSTFTDLTVEMIVGDRLVDLIDEGFDLALRVGNLADSSLVAHKLGDFRLKLVASPNYLANQETIHRAADLRDHNCIIDKVASFANNWPLRGAGKRGYVSVNGNISVNNGEIARDLVLQHTGIAVLPAFFVDDHINSGQLTEVLPGEIDMTVGLFALYPRTKHLAPKVRAFIDHLAEYLSAQSH
ncbi:MAG: LysR family transcriptional regulator [Pseudomonadota bacterium]